MNRSDWMLTCNTAPGHHILNEPQIITITWNETKSISLDQTFTYLEDPEINDIRPLKSIKRSEKFCYRRVWVGLSGYHLAPVPSFSKKEGTGGSSPLYSTPSTSLYSTPVVLLTPLLLALNSFCSHPPPLIRPASTTSPALYSHPPCSHPMVPALFPNLFVFVFCKYFQRLF